MLNKLNNYYFNKAEPNRSCMLALRNIILEQSSEITETMKYRMPCFTFHKKAFCYLWIDKKTSEPYILMVDGKILIIPFWKLATVPE